MNPQSLNRYAYVLNNPTTLVDPLGLEATSCTIDGQQGFCTTSTASGGTPPGNNTLWDLATEGGGNSCNDAVGDLCGSGVVINPPWNPCNRRDGGDPVACAQYQQSLNGGSGKPAPKPTAPAPSTKPTPPKPNPQPQGSTIAGLAIVLGTIEAHADDLWMPAWMMETGGALVVAGAGAETAACFIGGPVGCFGAAVPALITISGGGALIYSGYQYYKNITVPEYQQIFQPPFQQK